jgi:hypothetical protein
MKWMGEAVFIKATGAQEKGEGGVWLIYRGLTEGRKLAI